jgi:hypothetical protein
MHDRYLVPVGMLLYIIPYAYLCYFPFVDKLRISKIKLILLLSLLTVAQFAFYYFDHIMSYNLFKLSFYSWLTIYFCTYLLTVRENFSKLIYVFLLIVNYGGVLISISKSLDLYFFSNTLHENGFSIGFIHIYSALLAATFPIAMYFYKKNFILLNRTDKVIWKTLWVIPLSFDITIIVFTQTYIVNLVISWNFITIILIMALGASVVYYVISRLLFQTNENAALIEKMKIVNMQLSFQENAYKMLSENISEAKAARHDLRHHLSVIEAYLQSDNKEELMKYLKEYKGTVQNDTQLVLCENSAANVIILHYVQIAREEGVTINSDLQLPQKVGITNLDLCIIFGNCLENAVEACRRMNGGQKYIHIKSRLRGNILVITIDNSYDGKIEGKNGTILSRKRDNEEGIGLSSVRAVAAKYEGTALISFDDKEFRTSMILNTQNHLN